MSKKEIRKIVKKNILDGKTKQEIFEELKETSYRSHQVLAKIIRKVPSLQAIKKYNPLNNILIVLLAIMILIKIAIGMFIIIESGFSFSIIVTNWFSFLFILPIVDIFLLIGVATYSPNSHIYVAIWAFYSISHIIKFERFLCLGLIAIIGLGFYLNSKLYPKYLTVKKRYKDSHGLTRLKNVIKFED